MNEEEIKDQFEHFVRPNFDIRLNVPGCFLVDSSKVVIDYLLFPKQHLIDKGFTPNWFGVEVKSPDGKGEKKAIRVAWQAITYSQSEFDGVRPIFILIYPALHEFFSQPREAYYLVCMLQKANVGYFEISPEKKTWKIKFGANVHFSSYTGISKTPNAGLKRHVGTWK